MSEIGAPKASPDLTVVLRRLHEGDSVVANEAASEVYEEMRRLARLALAGEQHAHSLNPTLIVNEVFVRLLAAKPIDWQDRRHFFFLASRMMRRVVVDHFREKGAQKRPKDSLRVVFEDTLPITEERRDEVLLVDQALSKLEEFDRRAARVMELRYFGGRTDGEIAALLDIHERTVRRDWLAGQAWLKQFLGTKANGPAAP